MENLLGIFEFIVEGVLLFTFSILGVLGNFSFVVILPSTKSKLTHFLGSVVKIYLLKSTVLLQSYDLPLLL